MWGLSYLWDMKAVIKRLLKERLLDKSSEEQMGLLNEFIEFAAKILEIKPPKVVLQYSHEGLVTTAAYEGGKIHVYAKERAIVDIMRSIAHEMTHLKQDLEKRLNKNDHDVNNAAGSPIEDEANYKAGEIIRKFGEIHPEVYI